MASSSSIYYAQFGGFLHIHRAVQTSSQVHLDHFYHFRRNPVAFSCLPPPQPSLSPHSPTFYLCRCPCPQLPHKWDHIICGLCDWLLSFSITSFKVRNFLSRALLQNACTITEHPMAHSDPTTWGTLSERVSSLWGLQGGRSGGTVVPGEVCIGKMPQTPPIPETF